MACRGRPLGTATIAVLQALSDGHRYGFDIIDRTGLPSGTVYPALAALVRRAVVLLVPASRRAVAHAGETSGLHGHRRDHACPRHRCEHGEVVGLIVRQGLKVAALGMLMGGAAALAATGLLGALLYGVGPLDPIAFGLTPVLLLPVAVMSSCLPARRAARVDPVQSLRAE